MKRSSEFQAFILTFKFDSNFLDVCDMVSGSKCLPVEKELREKQIFLYTPFIAKSM